MMRSRLVAATVATLAATAVVASCVAPPQPGPPGPGPTTPATPGPTTTSPPPVPATDDWPMLMHDIRHTGIAGTTALKASNASQLGMRYMTNTGNWVYSSPVVATVPSLGKQLVFVGNKAKFVFAFDAATGEQVWRSQTSSNNSSTPAVYNDVVYIGSSDFKMYAFSAVDGHQLCALQHRRRRPGLPTVVNPDGSGIRVYFGDAGLGGAPDGGHVWSMHGVDPTDAFADCSADWSYDQFGDPAGSHPEAGSWSSPSYGQLATGQRVIIIGASSTDNAAYAFDALTGARIWRFGTPAPYPDADVGAGTTFSPPGVNGLADGAAYIAGKNHHVYGINPRTGARVLGLRHGGQRASGLEPRRPVHPGTRRQRRSTSAGVRASSPSTPRPGRWCGASPAPTTSMSSARRRCRAPRATRWCSPPTWPGRCSASTPRPAPCVWQYQAGDLIYGSVAVAAGNVYFAAQDGFVYSFGLGAGNSARPHATIDSPTDGAVLPPGGTVPISGVATDDVAVTKVLISVRQDSGALWYDAAANKWQKYFVANPATHGQPQPALHRLDLLRAGLLERRQLHHRGRRGGRERPARDPGQPVEVPGRQRGGSAGHRHQRPGSEAGLQPGRRAGARPDHGQRDGHGHRRAPPWGGAGQAGGAEPPAHRVLVRWAGLCRAGQRLRSGRRCTRP